MNLIEQISLETQMLKHYVEDMEQIAKDPAFSPELKAKMLDGKARDAIASLNGLKDMAYELRGQANTPQVFDYMFPNGHKVPTQEVK